MRFSTAALTLATAGSVIAIPSTQQNTRSVDDVLPALKRDPSGMGFAHVGSDNVVRSFDARFNVVDFAQLDARAPSGEWPRTPSDAVLEEAKQAKARSETQVSKVRSRNPLENREQSCVSEFCPNDQYCKDLHIYGYNCTSCLIVSNNMGNCQRF
ncbi:hypothetical protein F4779DRAFT_285291 [Xylariaceae sp. FL0662B]|nr:hypothetical protein F4779DRAFT_285291 [Xylariaceae sp. FL0662B]